MLNSPYVTDSLYLQIFVSKGLFQMKVIPETFTPPLVDSFLYISLGNEWSEGHLDFGAAPCVIHSVVRDWLG